MRSEDVLFLKEGMCLVYGFYLALRFFIREHPRNSFFLEYPAASLGL